MHQHQIISIISHLTIYDILNAHWTTTLTTFDVNTHFLGNKTAHFSTSGTLPHLNLSIITINPNNTIEVFNIPSIQNEKSSNIRK